MDFSDCIKKEHSILMEGALGERLKREYHLTFDDHIAMAGLVYSKDGRNALKELWTGYLRIAEKYHFPFLAETPTRRANKERIADSCFDSSVIKDNVNFLRDIQKQAKTPMYIGGLLGCKGDAYTGEGALSLEESREFHECQVQCFAQTKVDFLMAGIMPSKEEAAGMALAIQETGIPYIISFTIEGNGCLIDGTPISSAVKYIDSLTERPPECYMTNCVHPRIVGQALMQPFNNNDIVRRRFLGIQANTSPLSYEELDHSADLKSSEPAELAEEMVRLREISPFKIFGGCCGTDDRHMEAIAGKISEMDRICY